MDTEALYATLAFLLFFGWFVLVLIDTWRKPKGELEHLEHLPLED